MKLKLLAIAALAILTLNSSAWAHFVWITIAKDSAGKPQAQVHFSELAEPDVATLLDKVAAVKVWSRLMPSTCAKSSRASVRGLSTPASANRRVASSNITVPPLQIPPAGRPGGRRLWAFRNRAAATC